jgi:hypothetical protein
MFGIARLLSGNEADALHVGIKEEVHLEGVYRRIDLILPLIGTLKTQSALTKLQYHRIINFNGDVTSVSMNGPLLLIQEIIMTLAALHVQVMRFISMEVILWQQSTQN